MFTWRRPAHLGVRDGQLARCRRTPNCVCSQADPSDRLHYIAPIAYGGRSDHAVRAARQAIETMPGASIVRHEENYLHAEFRTRFLRFIDDLELVHDEGAGLLHVRSASRLGRRDFGVNRKRVEALRRLIEARRSP